MSELDTQLQDVLERLEKAQQTLIRMSDEAYDRRSSLEGLRLEGKAQGIGVALSYLRELRVEN